MMKRKILAAVIPALLAAATANAAEIYNKDGNKLDLYGKAVGRHVWTTTGDSKNADQTYAQIGFKGETQINTDLTGSVSGNIVLKQTALKANSRTRIWYVWLSRV